MFKVGDLVKDHQGLKAKIVAVYPNEPTDPYQETLYQLQGFMMKHRERSLTLVAVS
jgi:hypothetical protein